MDEPLEKPKPNYAMHISRSALILTCVSICVAAQLGLVASLPAQGRDQLPAVAPRERAPDISAAAANVKQDAENLIAEVRFRGNQFVEEYRLNRNIGTRAGRYFDPDLVQQDVDKLWRMPEIKRVNGPFIEKTAEGLVITFEVVERKHIRSLKFIGNRAISDRALKKQTDLELNQPLDLHQIRMAKNRIEEYYKEKGHPKTQVEILNVEEVENGDVAFLIHEDEKQRVWAVEFVGNQFVSDGRLKNFIKSKPGIMKVVGGAVKENEIEQDIQRLESYYKSFGYFNARIGREVQESDDGRWLTIRYIIDEGPRYKINDIKFVGNRVFSTEQLNSMVELKPAEGTQPEFNVAKLNADLVSLRDLYGSQGFVYSDVEAETRFLEEPGALDIVYKISEGEQYRVGRINVHIQGDLNVTKREVALNQMGEIKTGDLINVREMRNSERRLQACQVFAGQDAGPGRTPPRIVVKPPELSDMEKNAKSLYR